jgi:hypothetical protein
MLGCVCPLCVVNMRVAWFCCVYCSCGGNCGDAVYGFVLIRLPPAGWGDSGDARVACASVLATSMGRHEAVQGVVRGQPTFR